MQNRSAFLAIEDKQVQSKIKVLLEKEGFVTEATDDGLSALNNVRLKKPSLVILSDMLLRMDGFKVCRFLKFDRQFQSIPVILLLSQQRLSDEKLAADLGADACLLEPFDAQKLLDNIRDVTSKD